MITDDCLVGFMLANGTIAVLVTVGAVGDAEFDDVESSIEHTGVDALDASGLDVEKSSVDSRVMAGVGTKMATVQMMFTRFVP